MGDNPKIEKPVHPRLLKEIPQEVIDDTHSVRITADSFQLTPKTPDSCGMSLDASNKIVMLCGPNDPSAAGAATTPIAPSDDASEVDKALHELATADTDEKRKFAAQKALAAAKKSPNAEVLAVPMVEAEIAAINGKYLEAAQKYAQLSASLQVLGDDE